MPALLPLSQSACALQNGRREHPIWPRRMQVPRMALSPDPASVRSLSSQRVAVAAAACFPRLGWARAAFHQQATLAICTVPHTRVSLCPLLQLHTDGRQSRQGVQPVDQRRCRIAHQLRLERQHPVRHHQGCAGVRQRNVRDHDQLLFLPRLRGAAWHQSREDRAAHHADSGHSALCPARHFRLPLRRPFLWVERPHQSQA